MNNAVHSRDYNINDVAGQPLHLGYFIDSLDPGGAEETVINLARGMAARGQPVTLYHFGNPWIEREAKKHNLNRRVLTGWRQYKSKFSLPVFIWRFRSRLIEERIDILHSHLLGAVFAGSIAARLGGIRSIGTLHDIYSLDDNHNAGRMIRASLRLGTKLVTVAETMRSIVCDRAKIIPENLTLIHNGVDLRTFAPGPDDNGEDTIRIICVARMEHVKRIDILLQAAAKIEAKNPWVLELLGDGPLKGSLQELSKALNLEDKVVFAGFRDDVPERLSQADIFALSSDSEGLSVSIVEAMAAGLPAVVTDVGGNKELVLDGESGIIAPAGDIDRLANALTGLIDDAPRRRAMGRQARAIAVDKYSYERMLSSHLSMYETL